MNALLEIGKQEIETGHKLGHDELIEIIRQQDAKIDKLESDLQRMITRAITLEDERNEIEKGSLKCLQVIENRLKETVRKIEEGEKNVKKVSQ